VRITAGVQPIQPAPQVGQLLDQGGQRHTGPGGGQLGGQPQRQRQPGALRGERVGGSGVRFRPGADEGPQQRPRLRAGEQVELQPVRAVPGDEADQRVPARHQHQAGRRAGQQRSDLLDRGGVVQHDQHPAAVQPAAVEGGPLLQRERELRAGHAQRPQEPGERVGRRRRQPRVVAAQVDVQLPVGERRPHPVRPVHGQGGLAHPGGAGDRGDHHGGPGRRGGLVGRQQPVQLGQFGRPPGEPGHVRRQLSRADPHRLARRRVAARRRSGSRPVRRRTGRSGVRPARHRLVPHRCQEPGPVGRGQVEGVGEQPDRLRPRAPDPAQLDIADRADAEAGPLGQLLLGQPGPLPPGTYECRHRERRLGHCRAVPYRRRQPALTTPRARMSAIRWPSGVSAPVDWSTMRPAIWSDSFQLRTVVSRWEEKPFAHVVVASSNWSGLVGPYP
jgi:hypothetical protein